MMSHPRWRWARSTRRIQSLLALASACVMRLCSGGAHASALDDQAALQRAVQAIRARATGPLRTLAVIIEPDTLTLRVQGAQNRCQVVEWRWRPAPGGILARRDPVSRPTPIAPNLINPDL